MEILGIHPGVHPMYVEDNRRTPSVCLKCVCVAGEFKIHCGLHHFSFEYRIQKL